MGRFRNLRGHVRQSAWKTLHVGGLQVQVRTFGEPPDPGAVYLCPSVGGRVDGLLAWIELAVAPGDAGLNSLVEDTNWLPVYVPFALDEPIEVNVGDVLSLQVAVANADDGIHPEYFFRGQLTRTGSGAEVTVSAESRYSGGAFRSTVVHRGLLR